MYTSTEKTAALTIMAGRILRGLTVASVVSSLARMVIVALVTILIPGGIFGIRYALDAKRRRHENLHDLRPPRSSALAVSHRDTLQDYGAGDDGKEG